MRADGAWHEVSMVLHVHSRLSDGRGTVAEIMAAAQAAQVDVVWLTDHDTLAAQQDPGEGYWGRSLLLVGLEVTPAQSHYLALGGTGVPDRHRPFAEFTAEAASMGHLGFVAHPDDPGNPVLKLPSYRWADREGTAYTGLEVWNHLSQWMRGVHGLWSGIGALRHPFRGSERPTAETLALWDRLGQERRVVGVAGVDAHAVVVGHPPLGAVVFPYPVSFNTLRTHVLVAEPLTGADVLADRRLVLEALAAGRVLAMSGQAGGFPKGFRFFAAAGARVCPMGSEAAWEPGMALRMASPCPARFTVKRDGVAVASHEGQEWAVAALGPGVWRVEADRPCGRRWVPWVVANPVYLRAPAHPGC